MFGISFAELLVIMIVALIVFGPEKLPEIASKLGKISFQLKKASDGFRREFYNSVYVPAKEQNDTLGHKIKNAAKDLVKLDTEPETKSNINKEGQ